MGKGIRNTIEEIENVFWGDAPSDSSNLVKICHRLSTKKIEQFSEGDYRILISQDIALEILIPQAIEILKKDIFIETHFYEGDLLKAILTSNKEYWLKHSEMRDC